MNLLPPLPGIRRQDPEHRYVLDRPGQPPHLFPVSITGVLAVGRDPIAIERINATRAVWEPRGNTVHLALEAFLHGRMEQLQELAAGDYSDWIHPLITHPRWGDVDVIASERTTYCLARNVSGTYDAGFRQRNTGRLVLADLKTLSLAGRTYSTAAQLGGYMALEATHGVHYDAGQTIWARPGSTTWSPLYSRQDCLTQWAIAWARWLHHRDTTAATSHRIEL
jgi:hypothetical protein